MKKLLSFLLIITMCLCLTGCKKANGSFTIIYTNDTHTYINNESTDADNNVVKGLSFSSVKALKDELIAKGENVLLVDAGDHVQGTYYGGISEGLEVIDIMNAAGYDVATLGNHEFDYGQFTFFRNIDEANFDYVSSTLYNEADKSLVLEPYKIFELGDLKVAIVGISTPETITTSVPTYFMDADGNYIYDLAAGDDGQEMYDYVQKAIDEASKKADVIIGLGHLGKEKTSAPYRSVDVIANTTGLSAFIDGHSHATYEEMVADKNGNEVLLVQGGSYFEKIGELKFDVVDGVVSVTNNFITEYENRDTAVETLETTLVAEVEEALGKKIGSTNVELLINDPSTGKRLIRTQEMAIGDLIADAYYWYFNEAEGLACDIGLANGGGIRVDVPVGDISYSTTKTVQPFGNVICLLEMDGQTILDLLEFASRGCPTEEVGGFLQVAGMKYTIDTTIESTVQIDDKKMWTGGPIDGVYRVKDVEVYNRETGLYEPLDLNKMYRVAGCNYNYRNGGDGFAMCLNSICVKDYVGEDYQVTSKYIMAFKDQTVSSENSPLYSYEGYLLDYENTLNGAGRISIIVE